MKTSSTRIPTVGSLLGFVIPLAFIPFMMGLGRQFINAGMARMPDALTTLAAYGLAFGLIHLLSSPFMQAQSLGLILIDSRQSFKKAISFILGLSLVPIIVLLSALFTPAGTWLITGLHGAPEDLVSPVIFALLCLSPLPFVNSLNGLQRGMLINAHRTFYISIVSLTAITVRIGLVFLFLNMETIRNKPILLPILVVYGGITVEILMLGFATLNRLQKLPETAEKELSFRYVLKFFWPLALVALAVGSSRPLINLLISRGRDGKEALAVLAIVFPLASLPYGWVNQNRNLVAAFRKYREGRTKVRRFVWSTGFFSFIIMIILFWTPIRNIILVNIEGFSTEIADLCKWPLVLFTFFPLAVMVRAYFQGIALAEHRTKALSPSAPFRLASILLVYVLLSLTPLHSAVTGTAALLSGFAVEALVVRYFIRRSRRREREMEQEQSQVSTEPA